MMQFTLKTGLSRLPLNVLIQRRKSLYLERKAMYLRIKASKRKIFRKRLLKQVKVLNFRIARLTKEINSRPKTVRQGGVSRPVFPMTAPVVQQFAPSVSSSFRPSVALPTKPVQLPESVIPKGYEYVEKTPSFVAEEPVEEMYEEEIIIDEPTDFDLMLFVEDNKFLIGGAVLAGLFLAFRPKAKKRSNPRRKSRKRKSVRKVRRNKRRSGYHRQ
jgi:hypothetical protein